MASNGVWHEIGRPLLISVSAGLFTGILLSRALERQVARALTQPPPYKTTGPPVSIIIPSLREEEYLPPLLQTIENQSYQPIEVIVADTSPAISAERTQSVSSSFGARYIYVHELGVGHARNEGAKQAKGDILVFMDADCVMSQDYVERMVAALEKGYVLAHGIDPCLGEGIRYDLPSLVTRSWFKPRDYTTGRGVAIWRDTFWEIGGYDELCDPMGGCREDLGLGLRVKQHYGLGSIVLLQRAVLGTSARREKVFGWKMWRARGVRAGEVIDNIETSKFTK